jgi:hypothetical protein
MSLRCGCPDQGDDIVFGPKHHCWPAEGSSAANLQAELDKLEAPHVGTAVREYLQNNLPPDLAAAIYDPPVQRWETTLDLDEAGGH